MSSAGSGDLKRARRRRDERITDEREAKSGGRTRIDRALRTERTVEAGAVGPRVRSDPVPNSLGARLAMLAGFAFGVVVVATLAGTLGAFFIDDRHERAEGDRSAS